MVSVDTTFGLSRAQRAFLGSPALYRGFVGGRGAGKTFISTYDLGAHRLEEIRTSWDSWRAENYPTSDPVH